MCVVRQIRSHAAPYWRPFRPPGLSGTRWIPAALQAAISPNDFNLLICREIASGAANSPPPPGKYSDIDVARWEKVPGFLRRGSP